MEEVRMVNIWQGIAGRWVLNPEPSGVKTEKQIIDIDRKAAYAKKRAGQIDATYELIEALTTYEMNMLAKRAEEDICPECGQSLPEEEE